MWILDTEVGNQRSTRSRCTQVTTIGTTVAIGSADCVQSDEPAIGGSVTAPTVTETENREIDADLEFTAAAVGVGERALSEANYEERRAFDHGMTRTYELGNQSFTAEVVSQLAEYHRRVDLKWFGEQELARFAVLSTPRVELGFQTFNPLNGITEETLLEGFQSEYEDVPFRGSTVDQFGTDRIRALVDVDMEPSPLKGEGYDHGSYTVEGLSETFVSIQTNPLDLLDRSRPCSRSPHPGS